MIKATTPVTLAHCTVTVHELNVIEIRNWFTDLETREAPVDLADSLLIIEMRLSDLARVSDITPEQLDQLTQTDIDQLMEAIQAINPRFFAGLVRLAELGQHALASGLLTSSAAPSASSGSDTPTSGTTRGTST